MSWWGTYLSPRLRKLAYWRTIDELKAAVDQVQRDQSALSALAPVSMGRPPGPRFGGWALSPSAISELLSQIEMALGTAKLLEVGGGMSTLFFCNLRDVQGQSLIKSVTTVEHDEEFCAWLARYSADTKFRPLKTFPDGKIWYDLRPDELGISAHNVLIIDGPPTGQSNREVAVDMLARTMEDTCLVLVDDVNAAEHARLVETLVSQWDMRPAVIRPTYAILRR